MAAKKNEKHSEIYWEARKEFINCIAMSFIGVGVPLVLAFREWKPIMDEELRKERAQQAASLQSPAPLPSVHPVPAT